uniref:Uncharacterized protein n=1 Tax=Opuntia streptacantha TaxID=393608 RepID=A0A7C9EE46_OPUST
MIQTGSVGGVKRAILLMGSGVGNLFFPLWIFSNPLFVLRWEMELECFSGKTSGAEINHSKLTSQTFLEWFLRGRLLCKRFCLGMGVSISGTSLLLEAQMIGKRKAFLICYLFLQIRK